MSTPITLDEATVRSVKRVELIEVVFPRGAGCNGHTFREVRQFWTAEGELVFEVDHFKPEQAALDRVIKCGWNVLRKDEPGYAELKPFNEAMNDYRRLTDSD